jgi:hypothetical protein
MAANPPDFREILLQHERTLRDLAHEVTLAREGGKIPPWVYTALSNAALGCADMLDYYRARNIPSTIQEAALKVQRAIGHLVRALDR